MPFIATTTTCCDHSYLLIDDTVRSGCKAVASNHRCTAGASGETVPVTGHGRNFAVCPVLSLDERLSAA
jgi:hypothetical protein